MHQPMPKHAGKLHIVGEGTGGGMGIALLTVFWLTKSNNPRQKD